MRLQAAVTLSLALVTACGSSMRVVSLETGMGAPLVRSLPVVSEQVQLSDDALNEALARLVLDVPLSLHPAQAGRLVLASASTGGLMDGVFQHGLREHYGRWCQRSGGPDDCLSLLEDGLGLDAFDRLRVAIAFALDPAWEGVGEAVRETFNPHVLKAMVVSAVATYVVLMAFPEPVVSKGLALALTAYLVAYLGVVPFLDMVLACGRLDTQTKQATTFEELEEAGARFGRVLGKNGARVVILLATAALGSKAGGLTAKGPSLPGFPQAALAASAQAGFRLAAVSGVRTVAVRGGGLVIGLAPSAVAMAEQEPPPGSTGSPGTRIPPPASPKAFPGLERVKPKTPVQGGGGYRKRWKDNEGNLYEWDSQHGRLEKYDRRGRHLGEFDPDTGTQTKQPDPQRRIDP